MSATSQQVCMEFLRVMGIVKQALHAKAEEQGLTFQQALVMHTLHDHGVMLMGAVADKLHCDASNVTGIIERLVSQGYVVRQETVQDRRAKQLTLTEKGNGFITEMIAEVPAAAGFDTLSRAEREDLFRLLRKLG